MFEASVSSWFAAAHQLRLYDGTLEPLHGHNWHVTATYRAERLDAMGVAVDFVAVRRQLDELLRLFHDRNLNDLPAFERVNPSAESVAAHIAAELAKSVPGDNGATLAAVTVEEAPGCRATFWTGR